MTFYLSGAIEFANEEDVLWRQKIIAALPLKFIDPTETSYIKPILKYVKTLRQCHTLKRSKKSQKSRNAMRKVIYRDLNSVLESNGVIVYWTPATAQGGGTKGEITMAFYHNLPVYLICPKEYEKYVPLWIWGCTTKSFKSVKAFIKYARKNLTTEGEL